MTLRPMARLDLPPRCPGPGAHCPSEKDTEVGPHTVAAFPQPNAVANFTICIFWANLTHSSLQCREYCYHLRDAGYEDEGRESPVAGPLQVSECAALSPVLQGLRPSFCMGQLSCCC
jgi:hypothetical protein